MLYVILKISLSPLAGITIYAGLCIYALKSSVVNINELQRHLISLAKFSLFDEFV